MVKKAYFTLTVLSSEKITPHMQRVIFSGSDLDGFPPQSESGYIKLLFSHDGIALRSVAEVEQQSGPILMRTYTVRRFVAATRQLTVDFVLHHEDGSRGGPASCWAASASSGDSLVISGPGPAKLVSNKADWFVLVGDMTALPAISCNLEQLPRHARGYAVIEILSDADRQDLSAPQGIKVIWVVSPSRPCGEKKHLLSVVKKLTWLEGQPFIWAACEFETMRALRRYFKKTRDLAAKHLYISSYWKSGCSEDQHKIEKKSDADKECLKIY